MIKPVDTSGLLAMRAAILQQNSALQRASTAPLPAIAKGAPAADGSSFTGVLNEALTKVSDQQREATAASEAYERGDTTDVASVMLAREQASVSFQATLQVRNKLLSAYKDIMSMPV